MTALQKAMRAARSTKTEMFGREEEVVRAVLEAVRSVVQDDEWLNASPFLMDEQEGFAHFIDYVLNVEPK